MPAEARQGYSTTRESGATLPPISNEQQADGVGFLHVRKCDTLYSIYLVRTNEKMLSFSSVSDMNSVNLRIAAVALGRCRGRRTSRKDRRNMWATRQSLIVVAFCSRPRLQFARGSLSKVSFSCDTYQVPGYFHLLLGHAVRLFPFFSAGSSKEILDDCWRLLAAAVFAFE